MADEGQQKDLQAVSESPSEFMPLESRILFSFAQVPNRIKAVIDEAKKRYYADRLSTLSKLVPQLEQPTKPGLLGRILHQEHRIELNWAALSSLSKEGFFDPNKGYLAKMYEFFNTFGGKFEGRNILTSPAYERPHLVTPVVGRLDDAVKAAHLFSTYAMLTPQGVSQMRRDWEATVPCIKERDVLGGLLYGSKETIAVPVGGSLRELGVQEHPGFIPADLPDGIQAKLVQEVFAHFNRFVVSIGKVNAAFQAPDGDYADNHLVHTHVDVINHSLALIASKPDASRAPLNAMTLSTALMHLREYVLAAQEKIGTEWTKNNGTEFDPFYSSKGKGRVLRNFLEGRGFEIHKAETYLGMDKATRPVSQHQLPASASR